MSDKSQAGWYPDPDGKGGKRYFDGTNWGPTAPPAQTLASPQPKKSGSGGKVVAVVVGIFFLLFLIGKCGSSSDDDKSSESQSSAATSSVTVSAAAPTPTGPKKPDATFSTAPSPEGEQVSAVFDISDNLTEGLIKDGARFETIDILEYAKATYPNAASVNVQGRFPMKDAYGNTTTDTVINLYYSKSTIDQINFDGVDKDKIWEIRDSGYVAPAFQP
ncbi:DUF2510 domain-containing protein [Mycolicibacterium farcinogenes]|uniref:DUF2510 domain-containing protein n=1 Tax=Mycolicibacterium farcinogenes TaxID=1802 RepID=A0ACD1FD95_MYCFR|nr:DUF2510 domain-containing protein [Mycolicibacterium farcinogenes]QZH65042.1 DUF2510 domain-containing protein [Mycolicibacterium farcinogenes]